MLARPRLLLLLLLAVPGCGDPVTAPPPALDFPLLDDELVIAASDPVPALATDGVFVAWVGDEPLVKQGLVDDVEVTYTTPHSCDEDLDVYDHAAGAWRQVGFAPGPGFACFTVLTDQHHTLRDLGWPVDGLIGPAGTVRLRGEHVFDNSVAVRVLALHPAYSPLRPPGAEGSYFSGLGFDGARYWLASNGEDRIALLDADGTHLEWIPSPGDYPFDLAFDGVGMWISDGTNRILRLAANGSLEAEFTVPTDFPGGLAWGDGSLWLAEYQGPDRRTFRIDPGASVQKGAAVVLDSWPTPGGGSWALAWVADRLVVVSDRVYLTDAGLDVVSAHDLRVEGVAGAARHGDTLALLCRGPVGIGNTGQKIVRFRPDEIP